VIQHKLLKAIPLFACANFACTQFQPSLNNCAQFLTQPKRPALRQLSAFHNEIAMCQHGIPQFGNTFARHGRRL
jgi:hypothetical protein